MSMATTGEFVDSSGHAGDAPLLQERFAADSYLFFRALLPADAVARVAHDVLALLARRGWVEGDRPATGPVNEGDDAYFPVYAEVQALESFHRLAHSPELLAVARAVLGRSDVFAHPRKIARINFPDNDFGTTGPHQDFRFIQGTVDVLTVWLPLLPCPQARGGLKILAGSHRGPLRPSHPHDAVGGLAVDDAEGDWRSTDYLPGDVAMFHSLTVHAAQPNRSQRMRLSVDFRYQSAADPIVAGSLQPHYFPLVPGWLDLAADWADPSPAAAPAGLTVVADTPALGDHHAPAPSRLV